MKSLDPTAYLLTIIQISKVHKWKDALLIIVVDCHFLINFEFMCCQFYYFVFFFFISFFVGYVGCVDKAAVKPVHSLTLLQNFVLKPFFFERHVLFFSFQRWHLFCSFQMGEEGSRVGFLVGFLIQCNLCCLRDRFLVLYIKLTGSQMWVFRRLLRELD